MRAPFALLLGMLAIAAPALPLALAVNDAPAPDVKVWAKSPPEPPLPTPVAPPRWDKIARESLALLRRTTVSESRRVVSTLAACEKQAARGDGTQRNVRYRKCATAPLARTDGFATSNSRILTNLLQGAGPSDACRQRVLNLTGAVNTLGMVAHSTLRTGLDAPWGQVLAASRAIRRLAVDSLAQAGGQDWAATCKPRPAAPAPEGPVL